jgi:hypothetical protein
LSRARRSSHGPKALAIASGARPRSFSRSSKANPRCGSTKPRAMRWSAGRLTGTSICSTGCECDPCGPWPALAGTASRFVPAKVRERTRRPLTSASCS